MILVAYFQSKQEWLDLPNGQKIVCLKDCWIIHQSTKFQDWIKEKYLNICLLFAVTNCTLKLCNLVM